MHRRILITGANAGIGRAAALQLAARGHHVLLGCRDRARGEEAAALVRAQTPGAQLSVVALDVSSPPSVTAAAEAIDHVDVVVHNAAFFDISQKARTFTAEGRETTWATNVLGPALLTELLLPKLLRSPDARVIAVTSKGLMLTPGLTVELDDVEFERRSFSVQKAYYQSKLAHLAWMLHLAERLQGSAVHVHGVRVTNVKIDIARYPTLSWAMKTAYALKSRFSITPDEMAKTYTWLAEHDALGAHTGGYYDSVDQPATPTRWATLAEHQRDLMQLITTQLGRA